MDWLTFTDTNEVNRDDIISYIFSNEEIKYQALEKLGDNIKDEKQNKTKI